MFIRNNFLFLVVLLAIVFAFAMKATVFQNPTTTTSPSVEPSEQFKNYWYAGKAELSSYVLEQARYGSLHLGEAVLIFVTEDFRTDKQVKLESDKKETATSVLKMNALRRFVTGIYDYSLMTSVFSPVDTKLFPHALKVSASAQDWCGHSYTQLNLRNRKYAVEQKSYFENEVQEDFEIDRVWLEDELWTRLRMNPEKLPTGEVQVVPSVQEARLRHKKITPETAQAQLDSIDVNSQKYSLKYTDRELSIRFNRQFPHQILGWEDTYQQNGKRLTTKATLKKTILSDYWSKHDPKHVSLRDSLGI